MSSRQYIKRVWRVPKDRGPAVYLSAVVVKLLVKHGWPAKADSVGSFSFCIVHHEKGEDAPDDFWAAVSIAVRIVARTYNVQVSEISGFVQFERSYIVTAGGHFKEANHVLPRESAP